MKDFTQEIKEIGKVIRSGHDIDGGLAKILARVERRGYRAKNLPPVRKPRRGNPENQLGWQMKILAEGLTDTPTTAERLSEEIDLCSPYGRNKVRWVIEMLTRLENRKIAKLVDGGWIRGKIWPKSAGFYGWRV